MSTLGRFRRLRHRLYHYYYRLKYFPFAKERRDRRTEQHASLYSHQDRGFIAVQIDALAHDDLERALAKGFAPNLKRLLERDGWELRCYPAGLPSATPAAQAAIFFGTKDRIPAFRFYEKNQRRLIIGSKPADVQRIRDRLPENGVLQNGSSYVNIFDGGADRAVFTLAARHRQAFLEKMGGGRLFLLALLHPFRMLRMAFAILWEYLLEEWNRLVSQIKGRYTYYWWYLPFLHIGSNVVLRELQTLAVLLDIYVGVPAIYTTYNSYDEFGHHFGPRSRAAYASIRALDRRIGEILRMLRRVPGRPYDLYVLSDHGQTPAIPYRVQYGETLGDTVIAAATHGVILTAGTGDYATQPQDIVDFLVHELEQVSGESSYPARSAGLRFGRWLRRHYGLFPLVAENVKASDASHLVITYSSSLAHLYWTDPTRPLTFDEVRDDTERRALYYFLVAHPGIGVVITRMLDGAHVETMHGRALITPDGEIQVLSGENPLRNYADTLPARRAIAQLTQWSNSGDLILFGAYNPVRDVCICFDDQVGAHGALGGVQFWPFLLTPRDLVPKHYAIDDPLDLHWLFRRYSDRDQPTTVSEERGPTARATVRVPLP